VDSYNEERQQLLRAVRELLQDAERVPLDVTPGERRPDWVVSVLRGVVRALEASLGECRQEVPYSTLHPVLSGDGTLSWCCNHKTEHCAPA
jgi:hypothetical protein